MSQPQSKKRSCWWWFFLVLLIALVVIVVVSFVLTSLFDLGVWDEFWDLVREKTSG